MRVCLLVVCVTTLSPIALGGAVRPTSADSTSEGSTSPSVSQCLSNVSPTPHHSTLPGTDACVLAFSDQIRGGLSDRLIHFAATHFAGAQKMLKSDNDQLRVYNPNWVLLHYQLGMAASPAQYIRGVNFDGSLVAVWDSSWREVNAHETWFMHNDAGMRHCRPNNYNCIFDISNPDVQNWWLNEAITAMRAAGAQGAFADSFVEGISGYDVLDPDERFDGINPGNPLAWLPGGVTWLDQRLRWIDTIARRFSQSPEQFLLIPNIGSQATGWDMTDFASSAIDGAMLEGIALDFQDTPDWILEMNRAAALSASGKIVLFQTYPRGDQGTDGFEQDVNFALGSYLLIKGGYSFVNLPGGNAGLGTGIFYYPQYEALEQLGLPVMALPADIGAYLWSGVFRRDFQNGLVLVNPSDSSLPVTLDQPSQRLACSGGGEIDESAVDPATAGYVGGSCLLQPVTSLTLAPWSAAIMFNSSVTLP